MKKFIIEVYTNWCGEEETFTAIAPDDFDEGLNNAAAETAYENFIQFNGREEILRELFPDEEEYTDEMENEVNAVESEYFGYSIQEVDDTFEYWEEHELIYDASEEDVEEEDDNEVEGT